MTYFHRRFREWDDPEELMGEALAYWWQEYCTSRAKLAKGKLSRDEQHKNAGALAAKRAAGRVAASARFARSVATQYVDAWNPVDSHRRAEIDEQRRIDAEDDAALRAIKGLDKPIDPWARCRIETFAALGMIDPPARQPRAIEPPAPRNEERCGAPSPRVRQPRPIAYQPVACEPAERRPIQPRAYGPLRLAREAWNADRLEARVDAGEWCYIAALEFAYGKGE